MSWKALVASAAVTGCVLFSGTAEAQTNTGTITLYHLNSQVAGRGVCIQMSPALSGTGWACVWKNNPLYGETTELLLQAFLSRRSSLVRWNQLDPSGHKIIDLAEAR